MVFRMRADLVQAQLDQYDTRVSVLAERIEALDRLTEAKFVTYRTLLDANAEKVALALSASKEAITKAEVAIERRFESVNEFRSTLTDQTSSFPSKVELHALADRVTDLATRLDRQEGRGAGVSALFGYMVAVVTVVVIVVNVIIYAVGN
jgi:hypothetical protein